MRWKALLCGIILTTCLVFPARGEERTSYLRNVVIEAGESSDSVTCVFCSVTVRGKVNGEVVTSWGGIEVQGIVTGELVVAGGGIHIGRGGVVEGEAVAVGGPVRVDAGATLRGDSVSLPWFHLPGQKQVFWQGAVACLGFCLVFAFLSLALLGARRIYVQAEYITAHPWRCTVVGLVLFALVIGALSAADAAGKYEDPIEYTVLGLWGLMFLAGFAGLCARLSRFLTTENMLVLALSGAVLFSLLSLIPYLGLVLYLLFQSMAMGVPVFTRLRSST